MALRACVHGRDICPCTREADLWPAQTVVHDAEGDLIEAAMRLRDYVDSRRAQLRGSDREQDGLLLDLADCCNALDALFADLGAAARLSDT